MVLAGAETPQAHPQLCRVFASPAGSGPWAVSDPAKASPHSKVQGGCPCTSSPLPGLPPPRQAPFLELLWQEGRRWANIRFRSSPGQGPSRPSCGLLLHQCGARSICSLPVTTVGPPLALGLLDGWPQTGRRRLAGSRGGHSGCGTHSVLSLPRKVYEFLGTFITTGMRYLLNQQVRTGMQWEGFHPQPP